MTQGASYDDICKACGLCKEKVCFSLSKDLAHTFELPERFPQTYSGARFTSDAMDCSLPIALDSHSGCSYGCTYCFANNLSRSPERSVANLQKKIREGSFYAEWPIGKLERLLARELKDPHSLAMYPVLDSGCPVQLGALGDPFDELEAHSGWAKKAIPLFIKYKIPVRVGTKGGRLLQKPEYLELFESSPDQFWFAFSIISNSDELISKVDIKAPVTSERLAAMKALTKMGCNASIRFRPFLPGISDAYPGEPEAWKKLILRARESGARAISFEYIFLHSAPTEREKALYRLMFRVMGQPHFDKTWAEMSGVGESCRRASRLYKYEMTRNIRDLVHELGMNFGCSDPHFKEWNDSGGCCGFPESGDKWFSNWSRRQMTEVIVQARRSYERGERRRFNYEDWKPAWAHAITFEGCVALKGFHDSRVLRNFTFGDSMRRKWNNPRHPRSPYHYFGGVLKPVGIDQNQDLVYEYSQWTETSDKEFKGELRSTFVGRRRTN
ncbi:MAG: hypothetical protein MUP27_09080 [Desulfobacterales bacterium]|nr:hypothetical protein [Desulfobacterales bacterium]